MVELLSVDVVPGRQGGDEDAFGPLWRCPIGLALEREIHALFFATDGTIISFELIKNSLLFGATSGFVVTGDL